MIAAAIRKDVQLLARDRGALVSLFVLPVVFMLAFGAMYSRDTQNPQVLAICPPSDVSNFQIAVPSNAVLFGFFLALTVAMSFANERRTGTWQRLLAAPVSRWRSLVAMLVPYFFIGLVQMAFFFSVGALVFGMHIAGSLSALALLSVALVFCAVALGLLFAAIGGSERQLGGFGAVALLVMGMLGGCMVPRMLMSPDMQRLGLGVPHAWALDGFHDVIVREGTSIADVAPSLGALAVFGTVFALIGVALFRFERV